MCLSGTKVDNIDQLVFNTVQDGFLGGYLAAGMSKTHVVATYGGENFGTVTIYEDGFWDGVQYYNTQHHTNVKVLGWDEKTQKGTFVGNFTNVSAGQSLANTFIGEGADVIFPVAGGVGLGTAKAVQTADSAGKHVLRRVGRHRWLRQRRPVLQVHAHQRDEGHHRGGQDRGALGGQRQVRRRYVRRHSG